MRASHVVAFVLMMSVLPACLAQVWPFAGQNYSDRKQAEAARAALHERIRASFEPRAAPLAAALKFVVPSKGFLEKRMSGMSSRYPQSYGRMSEEQRDYTNANAYSEYQLIADIIKRRNIFERVNVEEIPAASDAAQVIPGAGEVVIYAYGAVGSTMGLYYQSDKTRRTPLSADRGNPDFAGRYKYMIDSIEALAAGEKQ